MAKFLTYIFIFLFSFTSSVNAGYSDAINRGKTGAGIFSLKNFGNENTNGMSKTEWIVANADKDTISNGTLGLVSDLYNTATKKGEGEPFIISSIVTGLVVTGSLYSIQDSARKIYAWIDGKGYKGNTTYIDPIDGRIYTAEENLKEGAIELGAAATAGIAVKGVGKVVSKAKATKNTIITGSKSVNGVKSVENTGSKIEKTVVSNNANSVLSKFQMDDATFKKIEKVYAEAKRTNYNSTLKGYKGASEFKNTKKILPSGKSEKYVEFDLDPKIKGVKRNMERIVIEKNSGKVYYTNNHYETFVEITEELTKGK